MRGVMVAWENEANRNRGRRAYGHNITSRLWICVTHRSNRVGTTTRHGVETTVRGTASSAGDKDTRPRRGPVRCDDNCGSDSEGSCGTNARAACIVSRRREGRSTGPSFGGNVQRHGRSCHNACTVALPHLSGRHR